MKRKLVIIGMSSAAMLGCSGSDITPEGETKALVGVWEDCDDKDNRFSFQQDGLFSFDDTDESKNLIRGFGQHLAGTFTTDGQVVSFLGNNEGEDVEIDFSYYVNDSYFVYLAAHPDGPHEGVVGTWNTHKRVQSDDGVRETNTTLEIRADMTATITTSVGSESEFSNGTWRQDDDPANVGAYRIDVEIAEDAIMVSRFRLLDDQVLGKVTHCLVLP